MNGYFDVLDLPSISSSFDCLPLGKFCELDSQKMAPKKGGSAAKKPSKNPLKSALTWRYKGPKDIQVLQYPSWSLKWVFLSLVGIRVVRMKSCSTTTQKCHFCSICLPNCILEPTTASSRPTKQRKPNWTWKGYQFNKLTCKEYKNCIYKHVYLDTYHGPPSSFLL